MTTWYADEDGNRYAGDGDEIIMPAKVKVADQLVDDDEHPVVVEMRAHAAEWRERRDAMLRDAGIDVELLRGMV